MTDFKSHANASFKATKAYVRPDTGDNDQVMADKIVLETDQFEGDQVTIKPRYMQDVERKVDGVLTKDQVPQKHPIKQLPSEYKELIREVNNSEDGLLLSATVGEAINNGNSSFFITEDNFDTIDKQQSTIFGPEDETAEEVAEQEVTV